MEARDKYIKEMKAYWQATRGSGIKGTKAREPENFEQIIGDYYDKHMGENDGKQD